MLGTTEVRNILREADITGLDAVYAINLPREMVDSTDKTIALVRDATTKPDLPGNEDFFALDRQVEVQIFYAANPKVEPELLDLKMYKSLKKHDWSLTENRGHTYDPDTHQLTSTFYVTNTEFLN